MLEARGVHVWLDQKWKPAKITEGKSFLNLGETRGQKIEAKSPSILLSDPYGIIILRHVEGIFGNGGWSVGGGLLGRVRIEELIVDLYGKEIVWTSPHIPSGIFHAGPPRTESYDFILLRRIEGQDGGTILRRWQVEGNNVALNRHGFSEVAGILTYDRVSQTALISINGLLHPIEERFSMSQLRTVN